jgi:hypothetical protein
MIWYIQIYFHLVFSVMWIIRTYIKSTTSLRDRQSACMPANVCCVCVHACMWGDVWSAFRQGDEVWFHK